MMAAHLGKSVWIFAIDFMCFWGGGRSVLGICLRCSKYIFELSNGCFLQNGRLEILVPELGVCPVDTHGIFAKQADDAVII